MVRYILLGLLFFVAAVPAHAATIEKPQEESQQIEEEMGLKQEPEKSVQEIKISFYKDEVKRIKEEKGKLKEQIELTEIKSEKIMFSQKFSELSGYEKAYIKILEYFGIVIETDDNTLTYNATSNDSSPSYRVSFALSNDFDGYANTGVPVVEVGKKFINNSTYVFGGGRNQMDISRGVFDCSSFIHWAFSEVGTDLGNLSSVTTDTLKKKGVAVTTNKMQPGDLVFFDTYKKDGHVGIYIGNGKFIGAQGSTGVAIADMSQGYWKEKFNGRVKRL